LNKRFAAQDRGQASQGERAYARSVRDWQAGAPGKTGAGATSGRASKRRRSGKQRGGDSVPDPTL